jgi:molecular chaperone DnaK (HSP70)
MSEAKFSIGIDLGTTNTALAYSPIEGEKVTIEAENISQVVSAGNVEAKPLLPSFLYVPGPELPEGSAALPWDKARSFIVGEFARAQGALVPARLISSAKSWLCHSGLDRRSQVLPWESPEDVPKLSPLESSARYLSHLRESWDQAHPDAPLAAQEIVLTVPASFDAIARELTVEAAKMAGLSNLHLLEEPQAALYCWLESNGEKWRKQVSVGDVILVVDVGGGTTDFSLIAVSEEAGNLVLQRVAVGDHILLGGDNMDLTLAYTVNQKLSTQGKTLDAWQLRALTHGCRQAKEKLFSDASLNEFPITVPSRGSSLFGKSIRTELTRAELTSILVDGFFPRAPIDAKPKEKRRAGLAQIGLPYASDPAVTNHLAYFLSRQVGAAKQTGAKVSGESFVHPTAVLFNGGVLHAPILQERVIEVLNGWLAQENGKPVRVLESASLDVAVARGASHFGRVRKGQGLRIKGGTARAYYVGVESTMPAVPGFEPPTRALCLAPFGMEEGTEVELAGQEFGLVVGEPAEFRFFASSTRRDDKVGSVVEDAKELEELPQIESTLEGEAGRVVPVKLRAQVTEIGTLQLWCVERNQQNRWKLEFNVRMTSEE